jgi:hypothetical protein
VSYKPGRNQSAEIDLEMTQMIEWAEKKQVTLYLLHCSQIHFLKHYSQASGSCL